MILINFPSFLNMCRIWFVREIVKSIKLCKCTVFCSLGFMAHQHCTGYMAPQPHLKVQSRLKMGVI